MKNHVVTLIILTIVLSFQSELISQNTNGKGKIISKSVKVYEKPDQKSKLIMTLTKNSKITLLESDDGWYKIKSGKKIGWVEEKNIVVISAIQTDSEDDEEDPQEHDKSNYSNLKESSKSNSKQNQSSYEKTVKNDRSNPFKSGINLGITAGCQLSSFSGKDAGSDYSRRIGLLAGVYILYRYSDMISAGADIIYSNKGAHHSEDMEEVLIKLDYIEIPLSCFINLNFIPYLKSFRIGLGPYLAYNFNAAKITKTETYLFSDVKKFDFGLTFGIGYDFKLFENNFNVFGKYNLGLTTVHSANSNQLDLKNNTFQFLLGWIIPYFKTN